MHWRQGGRDNFAITLRLWLKYKHLPRDGPWSSSEASSICQTHILRTCSVYAAGSRCCRRGWNMKIFHMLTRSHPSNYLLTIINSSTRRATKRQSLHHHHPLKESFKFNTIIHIGLPYSSLGLHIDSPIPTSWSPLNDDDRSPGIIAQLYDPWSHALNKSICSPLLCSPIMAIGLHISDHDTKN